MVNFILLSYVLKLVQLYICIILYINIDRYICKLFILKDIYIIIGSTLNLVRPTKYDGGLGGMDYYKWDGLYKSWLKGYNNYAILYINSLILYRMNILQFIQNESIYLKYSGSR